MILASLMLATLLPVAAGLLALAARDRDYQLAAVCTRWCALGVLGVLIYRNAELGSFTALGMFLAASVPLSPWWQVRRWARITARHDMPPTYRAFAGPGRPEPWVDVR